MHLQIGSYKPNISGAELPGGGAVVDIGARL